MKKNLFTYLFCRLVRVCTDSQFGLIPLDLHTINFVDKSEYHAFPLKEVAGKKEEEESRKVINETTRRKTAVKLVFFFLFFLLRLYDQ